MERDRRDTPRAILVSIVVLAIAVSACGGASDETDSPPASRPDDGEPGRVGSDVGGGATDRDRSSADGTDGTDEGLSPLGAHLGYGIPGLDADDDGEVRRLYQDTLADCMAAEGFEYVSWVPDPDTIFVPVEEGLDPDSREFATRYGFGISTQFFAQRDVGPGLVGHTGDGSGVTFTEDPNALIRERLPAAEIEAYDRAYWGVDNPIFRPPSEYDEEAEGQIWGRAISSHGCIGEAERTVEGDAGEVLDMFGGEILSIPQRAATDDRYLEYADAVERCVREAGFDFYTNDPPWAVLSHFDDLVTEIDELVGGNPVTALSDTELAAMDPEEIDALHDLPRELSDEARNRLAEVQDLETATAVAVWDCGGSADEQRRVLATITAELQREFIDANRAELERFRR
jgi:hypothetical protein